LKDLLNFQENKFKLYKLPSIVCELFKHQKEKADIINFITPLIDPSKFSFSIELLGSIPYDTKLFGILFEKLDWKSFKFKHTPFVSAQTTLDHEKDLSVHFERFYRQLIQAKD
jgi:hypothetical protein